VWLSEVLGAAERVWNAAHHQDQIQPGGGAALLRDRAEAFRRAFRAEAVIPEDPVMANARGLWKWAKTVRW
jgi:hypothetical protein